MDAISTYLPTSDDKMAAIREWQGSDEVEALRCGYESTHKPLQPLFDSHVNGVILTCPDCHYSQQEIPRTIYMLTIKRKELGIVKFEDLTDINKLEAAARHDGTPSDVLEKIYRLIYASPSGVSITEHIAGNPNTPSNVLIEILNDAFSFDGSMVNGEMLFKNVIANPNLPPDEIGRVVDTVIPKTEMYIAKMIKNYHLVTYIQNILSGMQRTKFIDNLQSDIREHANSVGRQLEQEGGKSL